MLALVEFRAWEEADGVGLEIALIEVRLGEIEDIVLDGDDDI